MEVGRSLSEELWFCFCGCANGDDVDECRHCRCSRFIDEDELR